MAHLSAGSDHNTAVTFSSALTSSQRTLRDYVTVLLKISKNIKPTETLSLKSLTLAWNEKIFIF